MENETKSVKLGVLLTNKKGNKTIKLGSQQEGEFAKYNYTVQVRVLDANGEVVMKAENPWVNLSKPSAKKDGTMPNFEYELQLFKNS